MTLQETKVDKEYIARMKQEYDKYKGMGLLEASSKSVVIFADKMLGFPLYAWQIDFATRIQQAIEGGYWTKEFVALTSRQIGKSALVGIISLWACVFNKYPKKVGVGMNTAVGIVSAGDNHAKTLLREVKRFIYTGDAYINDTYKGQLGDKFFTNLLSEKDPNNTTTITFKSYNPEVHGEYLLKDSKIGSTIESYAPTDIVLGKTFSIVIEDEAGKSDKVTDIFHEEYMYPTGNVNDAIRIYTSTPWTPSGFFYELSDPNDEFDKHPAERLKFTIDAIAIEAPEYYKTVQKSITDKRLAGKLDEVDRAYYCKFVKGETSYFNPEKVRECFDRNMGMQEIYRGECDMGIDFGGKTTSRTVITISTMDSEGVIKRLYHKTYEVQQDGNLLQDVEELLKLFNVQRIIPEECPQGDYVIRDMIDKGWNIHPMNPRTWKVKKYGAFRAALNRGEIKSYPDSDLSTEMLALETNQSKMQSVIQHAPGYSDDLIDSWLMSTFFYVQDEGNFNFYDVDDEEWDNDDWGY